jgi:hypothetical protein
MSYNALETSSHDGSKVELYLFYTEDGKFSIANTTDRVQIAAMSKVFVPAAIKRSELRQSAGESSGERMTITVPWDHPVAVMHVPYLPPRPVRVAVYSYHRRDLSIEIVQGFTGYVAAFSQKGDEAELACTQIIDTFQQQVPWAVFKSNCVWATYEEGCGVDRSLFKTATALTAVDGADITSPAFALAGGGDPNWFKAGHVVDIASGEVRFVIAQTGGTLRLVYPFSSAVIGSNVEAFAGDDRTEVTCRTKFNNKPRYLGFDHAPQFNVFERGST